MNRVQVADVHASLIRRGTRMPILVDIHPEQQHIHAVQLLEQNNASETIQTYKEAFSMIRTGREGSQWTGSNPATSHGAPR